MMSLKIEELFGGFLVVGDATAQETIDAVKKITGPFVFIGADPPYGNIVKAKWDKAKIDKEFADWMIKWTLDWSKHLVDGGAFYVWGGVGKPGFRPFFKYVATVEDVAKGEINIASYITWKKKRAYGVKNNYLFTREELVYFCKGPTNKPRKFEIPLLNQKRGYAGYNEKYKAKSEYLRRTNVWTDVGSEEIVLVDDIFDVTEVLKGKLHECQKPDLVSEIPIVVHTNPGEWVVELFGGSASLAAAAKRLDRKFVVVEKDEESCEIIRERLK